MNDEFDPPTAQDKAYSKAFLEFISKRGRKQPMPDYSVNPFCEDVRAEVKSARTKHPPQKSLHEGLAVLWEDFEEVKNEVFKKHPDRAALRKELIQVAAMAERMATDNHL